MVICVARVGGIAGFAIESRDRGTDHHFQEKDKASDSICHPSVRAATEDCRRVEIKKKILTGMGWGGGRFNLPNERTDHLSLSFLLSPSRRTFRL